MLVSSDPTQVGRPVDARAATGSCAAPSWTGTQAATAGTPSSSPRCRSTTSTATVVGVAAVGREVPSVWSRLGDVAPNLLVYLGVASVLGLGGSLLLSRRVKRQTLGMEPTEIAGLVEHREALVHGVKEGVDRPRPRAAG